MWLKFFSSVDFFCLDPVSALVTTLEVRLALSRKAVYLVLFYIAALVIRLLISNVFVTLLSPDDLSGQQTREVQTVGNRPWQAAVLSYNKTFAPLKNEFNQLGVSIEKKIDFIFDAIYVSFHTFIFVQKSAPILLNCYHTPLCGVN